MLDEKPGTALVGWTYDGPFDELPAQQESGSAAVHRVILWDQVGETEGTGIVHIAPGCGAEDFALGKQFGLPAIAPLDEEGFFLDGFEWLTGTNVSGSAQPIFHNLKEKGILYRLEDYTHRYPVCWRCQSELVFRLVDEWFISMGEQLDKPYEQVTDEEKARNLRYQIMEVVQDTRWIPDFGFEREMDWLRNMHDWMISKKRYWGLALPIWTCPECGWFDVIGSEQELKERAVAGWDEFAGHTPHRPYVDAVKIRCAKCGGTASRIPDVGNPWLDAGIVAYSTLRYRTDPRLLADLVPGRPDHRELSRPVPQLVLQHAGHEHDHGAQSAVPHRPDLCHPRCRGRPADAQVAGATSSSSTRQPTRWAWT